MGFDRAELLLQFAHPAREVRFDRVARDAEDNGDAVDVEFLVIPQHQAFALAMGKRAQRVDDLLLVLAQVDDVFGCGSALVEREVVAQRDHSPAIVIARQVADDAAKVRGCPVTVVDAVGGAREPDEGLLHQILGGVAIIDEEPSEANQRRTFGAKQVNDEIGGFAVGRRIGSGSRRGPGEWPRHGRGVTGPCGQEQSDKVHTQRGRQSPSARVTPAADQRNRWHRLHLDGLIMDEVRLRSSPLSPRASLRGRTHARRATMGCRNSMLLELSDWGPIGVDEVAHAVVDDAVDDAVADLLESIRSGAPLLGAIASSLEVARLRFDVDHFGIAVEDADLGRQVFTAGRRALGPLDGLCFGPERIETFPRVPVAQVQQRILLGAIRVALDAAKRHDPRRASLLIPTLDLAGARARRSGWSSTVVIAEATDRTPGDIATAIREIHPILRAGELLEWIDEQRFGWLLDRTPSDQVPAALARLVRDVDLGRLVFGMAVCPNDGTDTNALIALAQQRLDEARQLGRDVPPSSAV